VFGVPPSPPSLYQMISAYTAVPLKKRFLMFVQIQCSTGTKMQAALPSRGAEETERWGISSSVGRAVSGQMVSEQKPCRFLSLTADSCVKIT